MIYTKKESLEDRIVRYLILKNQTIHTLDTELQNEKIHATHQGIYKSLRFLIKEEVVVKHKDYFSLNEEWKSKLVNDLQSDRNFELSEHESIYFDLNSLIHLDQQWKNITLAIQKNISQFPIFFYNPHDIWSFLSDSRKKSEETYYKNLEKDKIFTFTVNGGNTEFDKLIKKQRENDYFKVNLGEEIFKKTDYITIMDDYITTVRINKKTSELIEKCFKESENFITFQKEIQKVGIEKKKVKLIIERNKEKAKKLRKKISKDFYISRELREKFDLF